MTIFAIDLGNKQTKMTDGQHTYIYPSSLLQARKVDSGFSLDDKMDNMDIIPRHRDSCMITTSS